MNLLNESIEQNKKICVPIGHDLCTCPNCNTYNEIIKKRRKVVIEDIIYCWHCGQKMKIKNNIF